MAEAVAEGASEAGAQPVMEHVEYATMHDLVKVDAVAFGTPSYWGTMAGLLKCFFERLYESAFAEVKGKPALAFAQGNSVENAQQSLQDVERRIEYFKTSKVKDGVACKRAPDEDATEACRQLGVALVQAIEVLEEG
jgi:flavorubredoxin